MQRAGRCPAHAPSMADGMRTTSNNKFRQESYLKKQDNKKWLTNDYNYTGQNRLRLGIRICPIAIINISSPVSIDSRPLAGGLAFYSFLRFSRSALFAASTFLTRIIALMKIIYLH
jgi:hypothetical protein